MCAFVSASAHRWLMPISGLHHHSSRGKPCSCGLHTDIQNLFSYLNLALSLSLAGMTELTCSTLFLTPASTAVHLWKDLSSTLKHASSQGPYSWQCDCRWPQPLPLGLDPNTMGVYNQLLLLDKHLQLVPASESTPPTLATTTACPSLYSLRTPIALESTVDPHSAS